MTTMTESGPPPPLPTTLAAATTTTTAAAASKRPRAKRQAQLTHRLRRDPRWHDPTSSTHAQSCTGSTRFLLAGAVGLAQALSTAEVMALLGDAVGRGVTCVQPTVQSPFTLIAFCDANNAARTRDALNGTEHPQLHTDVCLEFSRVGPVETAALPPGVVVLDAFVSEAEAAELTAVVDAAPWSSLARRRVQHYGYEFDYSTAACARTAAPLPDAFLAVRDRLMALEREVKTTAIKQPVEREVETPTSLTHPGPPVSDAPADERERTCCALSRVPLVTAEPDQVTVNEYEPGQGIPPHVDTHSAFQGEICALSLGSACVMELVHPTDGRRAEVVLQPRSLLVLSGEARYQWQHTIPKRRLDVIGGAVTRRGRRLSLTFRAVRNRPCECPFAADCDRGQWEGRP